MTSALAVPAALALFSAITVAVANFAVKRGGDVLTARMVLSITMGLSVVPFVPFVPLPPVNLIPAIGLSVVVHWFYQLCLIRALHRGALSLVFPVMRGLGPLMVAIGAAIELDEYLTVPAALGLVMASCALIVFALRASPVAPQTRLDRIALFWAVMTSIGIGLYSVVDASVARAMPQTATFIVWLFLLDWIGITAVTLYTRRGQIWQKVQPQLKAGMLGGLAGTLSYGAAIYAFTLADAAFVAALRETSVLFAAILGAVFLKESFGARRIAAASVLATGLILMQVAN